MAGGLGDRIIRFLDWCWPFPLGIFAATLAFVVGTGIWLAIRSPKPRLTDRSFVQTGATHIPASERSTLPSSPQDAAPAAQNPTADPLLSTRPTPAEKTSAAFTAARATPQAAKPPARPRRVAPPLSAKQQAELTDRLTIGRFLMDRKEYSAALKEFQAALAIDPASPDAQAAIQQAREAAKN